MTLKKHKLILHRLCATTSDVSIRRGGTKEVGNTEVGVFFFTDFRAMLILQILLVTFCFERDSFCASLLPQSIKVQTKGEMKLSTRSSDTGASTESTSRGNVSPVSSLQCYLQLKTSTKRIYRWYVTLTWFCIWHYYDKKQTRQLWLLVFLCHWYSTQGWPTWETENFPPIFKEKEHKRGLRLPLLNLFKRIMSLTNL